MEGLDINKGNRHCGLAPQSPETEEILTFVRMTEYWGLFSGGSTGTANFTAYVNPYMVVSKGGNYTKHIYIGSQRIVSKLGDLESYGADPRRIAYAGANVDGADIDFADKYELLQQTIKDRYAKFGVPYLGKDNDDYVNGQGFCCDDTPANAPMRAPMENDNPELYQYYYHSDHLGSTSLITNLDGDVVQHVEYVPFGEVFIEERNNTWNTPYLFNAKELDEETGLYYYGARYYDPRVSIWLSADPPLIDGTYFDGKPNGGVYNSFNLNGYIYTGNNPIKFVDAGGNFPIPIHIDLVNKAFGNNGMEASESILRGTGRVADVWRMADRRVHLTNLSGLAQISAAFNGAVNDFYNAMANSKDTKAGVALHAIADFYSHSNYIEVYKSYAEQNNLSMDINDIPTFSEAMQNPELSKFLDDKLQTGVVDKGMYGVIKDKWFTKDPASHKMSNVDTNKSANGQNPYNENATLHDAARVVAEKELTKVVSNTE